MEAESKKKFIIYALEDNIQYAQKLEEKIEKDDELKQLVKNVYNLEHIEFKFFRNEDSIFNKIKMLDRKGLPLPDFYIVDLYNLPLFFEKNKSIVNALFQWRTYIKPLYYIYFFPKFLWLEIKLRKALKTIPENRDKVLDILGKKTLRIYPWEGIRFLVRLGEDYFGYKKEETTRRYPIVFVNSMYLFATESIWNLYKITPKLGIMLDCIDNLFVKTFGKKDLGRAGHYRYIIDVPKIQQGHQKTLKPSEEIPESLIDNDTTTLIEEIKKQIHHMET